MFSQGYSLYAFAAVCCLAMSAQADNASIMRFSVEFDINVDGSATKYGLGLVNYMFNSDDVKILRNEDSTSVELLVPTANLIAMKGSTHPKHLPQYDIKTKGVLLIVKTTGSAQLSADGKRIENCQFEFADAHANTQVKEVVKKGLYKALPRTIGQELCDNIKNIEL